MLLREATLIAAFDPGRTVEQVLSDVLSRVDSLARENNSRLEVTDGPDGQPQYSIVSDDEK